jgi:hypothetical protein
MKKYELEEAKEGEFYVKTKKAPRVSPF